MKGIAERDLDLLPPFYKRGMTFVGSKFIYSFMQAVGLVDDQLAGCRRNHPGVPKDATYLGWEPGPITLGLSAWP